MRRLPLLGDQAAHIDYIPYQILNRVRQQAQFVVCYAFSSAYLLYDSALMVTVMVCGLFSKAHFWT